MCFRQQTSGEDDCSSTRPLTESRSLRQHCSNFKVLLTVLAVITQDSGPNAKFKKKIEMSLSLEINFGVFHAATAMTFRHNEWTELQLLT